MNLHTRRETEGRVRPGLVAFVERRRWRQRRRGHHVPPRDHRRQTGPTLRQFLSEDGRGGVRDRVHDLLGPRVRPILRARAEHQVPQHHARPHAGDQDGVHLHTDVFYISQQRGSFDNLR